MSAYSNAGRRGGGSGRGGFGGKRTGVRYGDGQVVQVVGPGMFYPERKRIPFWLVLLWRLVQAAAVVTVWTLRKIWRYPAQSVVVATGLYVWARWGVGALITTATLTALLAGVIGGLWRWKWPASFAAVVVAPLLGMWRWQTGYRRKWLRAMAGVGLLRSFDGVQLVPQVATCRSWPDRDVLTVQLLDGQTPDLFAGIGEALAHAYRMFRVDVTSPAPGWVQITFLRWDPLAAPVTVHHPTYAAAVRAAQELGESPEVAEQCVEALLDAVPVGVTENGHVATLRVRGAHLMVAGTTGSGKSGLLWALIWALAPAIRRGLVEVVALDPKRMELVALAEGSRPLGTVVKEPDVMAAFLEGQVRLLDDRCAELEGQTRKHTPTVRQPHRLIVVDELATLTALADRKDKERIEAALGHLESRGRAAGVTVVITTVEPTKEVVRWRALHSVRVGFRMEEESHTDMVLGDGTRDRGAACDQITPTTPGVAYLKVDGVRDPIRFRTAEITDTDLAILTNPLPACSEADRTRVIDLTAVERTDDRDDRTDDSEVIDR